MSQAEKPVTGSTRVFMIPAESRQETLQCQRLIADVYNRQYGVVFSADSYDLAAKVEPWPHRYLFGTWQGSVVCTVGLYLRDTYVERFGGVPAAMIDSVVARLGGRGYSSSRLREVSKIVVAPAFRGRGLSRILLLAAHARVFLQQDTERPALSISCARLSIYRNVFDPVMTTHRLTDFPYYPVHEKYRSAEDQMESRIAVPDVDVSAEYYDHALPGSYELPPRAVAV